MTYGVNAPLGFEPIGTITGSPWNGATRSFTIANAYATSIFSGDPIAMITDGTIGIATSASATNPILGVFQGCQYVNAQGVIVNANYWPAATNIMPGTVVEAFCIIDPNMLYSIQTSSATGAILTNNFANCPFIAGTGNTQTGQSGYALNVTPTASAGADCKILGSPNTPSTSSFVATNTWGIGYNNVIVMINNHALRPGTVGLV